MPYNRRHSRTTIRPTGKILSDRTLLGQKGVNLIERIVLGMGFLWYPSGQVEAGIDGYIEIRDPTTGEATNCIILVQSRATSIDFANETTDGFDYYPEERDLHYWLYGNAPVILIRSRPDKDEAYWVSIKDYFGDRAKPGNNKIHFSRSRDRFDVNSRSALVNQARPQDAGLYIAPVYKHEKLYSNLLPVVSYAQTIFVADTPHRYPSQIWEKFRDLGFEPGDEWLLKSGKIISFHDLRQHPWSEVCDANSIWLVDSSQWSQADQTGSKHEFIGLLNYSLRSYLRWLDLSVRYFKVRDYYFVMPTKDLSDREWQYPSLVKTGRRKVFQTYPDKKDPNKIAYCRHAAFEGRFVRYDQQWYLEINPTYHFTSDGWLGHPSGAALVSGIKRIERHHSVIGQVVMWASRLNPRRDLFTNPYPFLAFGPLASFDTRYGIDDREWFEHEEDDDARDLQQSMDELPLLGLAE